jgi:FkbM family methyltransferase
MKVEKLMANNQGLEWFERITNECAREYPMHLVDIEPNELVIDAGCNVGGFTQAFKYRFNRLIAIDASSYNVDEYKKNHHFGILHKALTKESGKHVQLRKYMGDGDNDTNSGNFGITGFVNDANNHGYRSEEYEEVETMSLEELIERISLYDWKMPTLPSSEIGLLKIDIEGSEFDFLYKKDLSKIKYITGEFHNWLFQFDDRGVELLDWIGKTHNEIYSDGDGNGSHFVKLWKRK